MSEFFTTKRSATLVLISDKEEEKRKTDLVIWLHAVLSRQTCEDFAHEKYSPPVPDDSLRYRIETKDGLIVNILDTPVIDADGSQADIIIQAVTTLSTVDAFVVVLDQSRPGLGDNIKNLLSKLSATFPRPIEKSIVFLFTSFDFQAGSVSSNLESPPVWLGKGQVVGIPIPDMVEIRNHLGPKAKPEQLHPQLDLAFKWSAIRLEPLWKYINSSNVQACEMKNLYLRAANIESEIYQTMVDNPAPEGDQAMGRITMLVNEYRLISTSPDFITHLELVIELLRTRHKTPGIEACAKELERAHNDLKLKASNNKDNRYLKCYTVSEVF